MSRNSRLGLLLLLLITACQPAPQSAITIIDNDQILTLQTNERVPATILAQAGIILQPDDAVLLNGIPISPDQPSMESEGVLQIRRAVPLTLQTPGGEQEIMSSAQTVGAVLDEVGLWLRADEEVVPALDTPITEGMTITLAPPRALTIRLGDETVQHESSAETVGAALAKAGIPLIGLDYSVPPEDEPLPPDGQIRLVRVTESLLLAQKPIPFETDLQASADVPLDQIQILQPGETGLSDERIRIRYEDGEEISRLAEAETLVRPPKTRLMGYGTKIDVRTTLVEGVEIEYWRAVQMWATSYSPCRSGVDRCLGGTSSGMPLRKGVVGLRYDWYLSMQGQRLYIPGYGFGAVGDVCGGCVGRPWIDLGYSDNDFQPWSSWVTVYFLTPIPASVIHVLE